MQDCNVCLSAGSVNQWGVCEICGEEAEDAASLVSLVGSLADKRLSQPAAN